MGYSALTRYQLEPLLVYAPSCAEDQIVQLVSGELPTRPLHPYLYYPLS